MLANQVLLILSPADFVIKLNLKKLQKVISGTTTAYHTVWIHITRAWSGPNSRKPFLLVWLTADDNSRQRDNDRRTIFFFHTSHRRLMFPIPARYSSVK